MATAPKPGERRKQKERAEAARTALQITLKGETKTLHMADLGPADDMVARQQTGIAVQPFFDGERFGSDAILIIWWMARRKAGEENLRFSDVLAEYPRWSDLEGVEIHEVTDEEDDSPEG